MEINNVKRYKSFVLYAVAVMCMLFIAAPMQYFWGIWGFVATEVMFVIISFAAGAVWKIDFSKMLPVKTVGVREVSGSVLVYSGGYMLLIALSDAVGKFIPNSMQSVQNIENTITSLGAVPAVLVMGLIPAICEETLFRGAIMYPLKNSARIWPVVVIGGIMFGAFHLDLYRLPAMSALGMIFAYLFLKTDNILIPAAAHFINNFISIFAVLYPSVGAENLPEPSPAAYAGSMMILCGIGALLLYFGIMNINRRKYNVVRIICPVAAAALFVTAGILCRM